MLTNKFIIYNRDIDPNKKFISNAKIDHLYYLEEDFNTMFVDKTDDKSSFSLIHVNARSLFKNKNKLVCVCVRAHVCDGIGNDRIHCRIVKSTIEEFAVPLAMAFNKSLETDNFHDKLQIAKNYPYT